MLLDRLDPRLAAVIRLVALVLIGSSVLNAHHHPSGSGRGLVVAICFAACVVAWLAWTIWATRRAGDHARTCTCWPSPVGFLPAPRPTAPRARSCSWPWPRPGCARSSRARSSWSRWACSRSAVAVLAYDGSALGLLAYTLGFVAIGVRRVELPPVERARRAGRAAAGSDAALAGGAATRGAARGVDADRAGDP